MDHRRFDKNNADPVALLKHFVTDIESLLSDFYPCLIYPTADTIANLAIARDYFSAAFIATFKQPLRMYWQPVTGFDVCQFDLEIIKSGSRHILDFVSEKWGIKACRMIEGLATGRVPDGYNKDSGRIDGMMRA